MLASLDGHINFIGRSKLADYGIDEGKYTVKVHV
jgi:hypothetical protein